MTDERRTMPTDESDDEPTAAEGGRSDLDVPDPTDGYGLLADVPDDELRDAYRRADPEPSAPVAEDAE